MSWHDVIIVGGGPGGSTAAWQLARAGMRPLVLEAKQFPRVKLCAGWVTPPVWEDLELSPEEYPRTIQAFSQVRLTESGQTWESRWPQTIGYGIVRCEFDQFLLDRAAANGAEVKYGERITQVEPLAEGIRLVGQSGEYLARVVVGAGGTHCPIARHFSSKGDESLVVALEAETRLDIGRLKDWTPHHGVPELAVEPDFLGYGWYFSKRDYLNIGIGALRAGLPIRERLERYQQQLVAAGRIPRDVELEQFRGHSYYVYSHNSPLAGEHHVLIGDAGGMARPISGEGIGPAVHTARLAADVIRAHLRDRLPLAAYEETVQRENRSAARGMLKPLLNCCPAAVLNGLARTIVRFSPLRKRLLFEGCFGMRAKVQA